MGFSQGATLCGIALATPGIGERFSFGILVSGMKSRATQTEGLDYGAILVPTLHVIGLNDRVLPVRLSEGLYEAMTGSPKMLAKHARGHVVPELDENGAPILEKFLAERRRGGLSSTL